MIHGLISAFVLVSSSQAKDMHLSSSVVLSTILALSVPSTMAACPKETPCADVLGTKCVPGDASKSNGAGLVWCGTNTDYAWCANTDACYDFSISLNKCVCTGSVPCRNGAPSYCTAFDDKCASKWSTYCPSVSNATATRPSMTMTVAPTTAVPTGGPDMLTTNATSPALYIAAGAGGALVLVGIVAFVVARRRHHKEMPHNKDNKQSRPIEAVEGSKAV
ncbi:Aste57867_24895 [Aphanomyces stellatus]|uniref:Aste57867_24895 protein n=1 Tax=Aphanomyces stellatus TaxID=120398 RepID=A0A485LVX5_9STRA|nr:hypothetical protein As57867_024817 [Aphanomyces stellatus]VFU01529.1 Aste57867_24895 [Aphanomyces stellatus]